MKILPKPIRRTQQALSLEIFFESLEPRVLLSGDWGTGVDGPTFDIQPDAKTDLSQANTAFVESAGTLTIDDQGKSQSAMRAGAMVDVLRQAPTLQEMAVVDPTGEMASSAGQRTPGSGDAPTTSPANLNGNASNLFLQTSRMVLPGVHELVFVNANVVAGTIGQHLLDGIAALTGADVAASADLTGSGGRGGDWDLEFASGAMEADILSSSNWPGDWPHLLVATTAANNTLTINEDATCRLRGQI